MGLTMDSLRLSIEYVAKDRRAHKLPAAPTVDFEFSFAFQPIVDASRREVVSFEALVRGPRGEPSADVFARVPRESLYLLDQACRVKAIQIARHLNPETRLNVNIVPNSICRTTPQILATLQVFLNEGFPAERLVFEVSEAEPLAQYEHVAQAFSVCRQLGFRTALDDFGTGYSGLGILAKYQPDYIKWDRKIIADIHENVVRQTIVKGIAGICRRLSIEMVAEGVEKAEEYNWLRKAGIRYFQGYYFGRPAFEALCEVKPGLF